MKALFLITIIAMTATAALADGELQRGRITIRFDKYGKVIGVDEQTQYMHVHPKLVRFCIKKSADDAPGESYIECHDVEDGTMKN